MATFERLLPEAQQEIRERVTERWGKEEGVRKKDIPTLPGWKIKLSRIVTIEVEVNAKTEEEAIEQAIENAESETYLSEGDDWEVERVIEEPDVLLKQFERALEEEAEKILAPECAGQRKIW